MSRSRAGIHGTVPGVPAPLGTPIDAPATPVSLSENEAAVDAAHGLAEGDGEVDAGGVGRVGAGTDDGRHGRGRFVDGVDLPCVEREPAQGVARSVHDRAGRRDVKADGSAPGGRC
jgi:hypothetical protein